MKNMVLVVILFACFTYADTITNKKTGDVYTGFVTQATEGHGTCIVSEQKGKFEANLADYHIERNEKGRKESISVLKVDKAIEYEIETNAFEKSLIEESNKGPLAILIEIDTPGGRVDLCKKMCAALIKTSNCKTIAYICGGENGGAYSAGSVISMACNDIYMAPGCCIGAATAILTSEEGVTDMKKAFGEEVGEKFGSAWRNYMASVAEQSGRPSCLAKAMAERDIEILEIRRNGKKLYIESNLKLKSDEVLRRFCPKGTLLTLTSKDAIDCGMSDGECESRDYVVAEITSLSPEIFEPVLIDQAREELEKVVNKFKKIEAKINKEIVEIESRSARKRLYRRDMLKSLRVLSKNADYLLNLKRLYPDVPVTEERIRNMKTKVDGLIAAIM
ncbi:MAG: hypothetical protein ACIAQZ_14525 [Sedimentisphaeraceae bacterium JB056]